jgi:hypothetical protein
MNLYSIDMCHYSPKDSESGIITYLLANSAEEVFDFISNNGRDLGIFNCWNEKVEDGEIFDIYVDNEIIGTETYRERMIRLEGEINDPDNDYSDAYYGITHYGWALVKTDISELETNVLLDLKIAIKK